MFKNKKPIVIAGGGIGGMTAALALAHKGLSCIVLEQAPVFREAGAGIQMGPNVFKMFDVLGILDVMKEIAKYPNHLIYVDGLTGKEFLRVPLGKTIEAQFKYPYGVFYREELLNVLINECKKSSLIQLITSAHVDGFQEHHEHVSIQISKGSSYEGDALIGADGLWSDVRRQMLGATPPRATGHVLYRGVVRMDSLHRSYNPHDVVHLVSPHCHFVHYCIGNKELLNLVAILESAHPYPTEVDNPTQHLLNLVTIFESPHPFHSDEGDPNEFQEAFKGCCKEIKELSPSIDTARRWMLYDRDPESTWTKGRVALLGDAAHPTLPYLTQGAGMAIEDALVIAAKVVEHQGDYPKAFAAYQKERYLRCAFVQYFSRLYGEAHHSTGVARELRNDFISNLKPNEITSWLAKMFDGIEVE